MGRWLLLVWLGLLLVPAAGLFSAPEQSSEREARMLAQPPALPRTLDQWLALPRDADAFIRDQFGFREDMIRANARIRRTLGEQSPITAVVQGRDGFLLLREGLDQSLGTAVFPTRVEHTASLLCDMRARLAERDIRFIFAIAPATTTIYPEAAPDWLGAPRAGTNYDLLMQAARACGADSVDLREDLRAQKDAQQLYRRTDTHWTWRGALIAYNAIAAALERPDLHIDPTQLRWRTRRADGDLTRMSGAIDTEPERVEAPRFRRQRLTNEQMLPTPTAYANMQSFVRDYPRQGPRVLVIGDSFAHDFFPNYLAQVASSVSFIHHRYCTFDWADVERAAPDIVIYMPTERLAACPEDSRPEHFEH